jgi:hypothetical protein
MAMRREFRLLFSVADSPLERGRILASSPAVVILAFICQRQSFQSSSPADSRSASR